MDCFQSNEAPSENLFSFQDTLRFHLFFNYKEQIKHLLKLTYKFSDAHIL